MIKKEEFERQYNSKFVEAISCSRVVVEPVSSGTYEAELKGTTRHPEGYL